jgi:glycosyltransferase involved in cell wall biosynthesis
LKQKARISAADRITFRSPVSPQEIPETINAYDIGLFLLPPVNFNRVHALPNKLFEFIMAGLAIAIGPSPEMARIVRAYRLGIVADTFEPADLAQRLNALTPEEINAMKRHSLNAAKRFSADAEMGKLLAIYRRVLAEPGC